jgi:Fe-S-cluster containining protein
MDANQRRTSLATIRMDIHGRERAFAVSVPLGPSRLLDLLPATRVIANQEAEANIDRVRAAGKEISCKAGCGACCRQIVAISAVEAKAISDLVASMPAERQAVIRERFRDGIRKLEAAGLLDPSEPAGNRYPVARECGSIQATMNDLGRRYVQQQIACPFLENESCGIYDARPAVCRQYHVTSPAENCAQVYEVPIDRLEPIFHVSHILGDLAEQTTGLAQNTMMLIQSLEWAEANTEVFDELRDGKTLFESLMNEIGKLADDDGAKESQALSAGE